QANGNVTITANQPGASVFINSSVNWHAGGVFKIQAGKDVKFEAGIDPTLLGDAGVTIQAGSGDVDFGGFAAITTVQSPIGVTAGGNILGGAEFRTGGTATGTVSLTAGNSVSVAVIDTTPASAGLGGDISLTADNMDLQGAPGSINAGSGLIWVQPASAGRAIELGGNTFFTPGSALQLVSSAVDTFNTTGELRIGSSVSGNLVVSGAIAPTSAGTLKLESGGSITTQSGGSLAAGNLEMTAVGGIGDGAGGSMLTNATQLSAGNSGSGDIRVANVGALTVADLGFGYGIQNTAPFASGPPGSGNVFVRTTSPGSTLTIAAPVTALGVVDFFTQDADLTTTASSISGRNVALNAQGVSGGRTLTVAGDLNASVAANNLTATNNIVFNGTRTINSAGPTTLTAGNQVLLNAGSAVTIPRLTFSSGQITG